MALVKHALEDLQLIIPPEKMMVLAADPVPFLGFVLNHDGIRALRRNEQRFAKKLRRADKAGASDSVKAQMVLSFESWRHLGKMENLV